MKTQKMLLVLAALMSALDPSLASADCRAAIVERLRTAYPDPGFMRPPLTRGSAAAIGGLTAGAVTGVVASHSMVGNSRYLFQNSMIGMGAGALLLSMTGANENSEEDKAMRLYGGAMLGFTAGSIAEAMRTPKTRGPVLAVTALGTAAGATVAYIAARRSGSPSGKDRTIPDGMHDVGELLELAEKAHSNPAAAEIRHKHVFRKLADDELDGNYSDIAVLRAIRRANASACVDGNREFAPSWRRFVKSIRSNRNWLDEPGLFNLRENQNAGLKILPSETVATSAPAQSTRAAAGN